MAMAIAACGQDDNVAPSTEAFAATVLPRPLRIVSGGDELFLPDDAAIVVDTAAPDTAAMLDWFLAHSRRELAAQFCVTDAGGEPGIGIAVGEGLLPADRLPAQVRDDAARLAQAYALDVTAEGVRIRAATDTGAFYALVTLWQLARPDPGGVRIPAVSIVDAPRFEWRGLMIDSARHMQSPAFIRRVIDLMALHKLNVLHWHLADDQGWRLDIRKYPELARTGGFRQPAIVAGHTDAAGERYGGFYTQDEIREIVAHAASRHITVVPEIDLPGHTTAAIVAYPRLGTGDDLPDAVPADWGIYDNVLNLEADTIAFFEDVLAEVVELFPSPYIHLGGDEVETHQWRDSARVRRRMQELGLESLDDVQNWHFRQLYDFLATQGRRAVGWDEIAEGDLPADAVVMSWRGIDGGIAAARRGHDAVLAPAPTMYLDHLQTEAADAPPGRGVVVTPRDILEFDPLPDTLAPHRGSVLGVQVNLWTEHVRTEERAGYMIFPRAAALAELGWAEPEPDRATRFEKRLPRLLSRYAGFGVAWSDDLYAAQLTARAAGAGRATVSATRQSAVGEIRYSTGDALPGAASPVFDGPLDVALPVTLAAQTFVDGRPVGEPTRRTFDERSVHSYEDRELESCNSGILLALEDDAPATGERESFLVDIMHPCWLLKGAKLDGITGIRAAVGNLPFNFRIGEAVEHVIVRDGEPSPALVVKAGSCDGPQVAALPIGAAADNPAVTELPAVEFDGLPADTTDLCFYFHRNGIAPIWALDRIELVPATDGAR